MREGPPWAPPPPGDRGDPPSCMVGNTGAGRLGRKSALLTLAVRAAGVGGSTSVLLPNSHGMVPFGGGGWMGCGWDGFERDVMGTVINTTSVCIISACITHMLYMHTPSSPTYHCCVVSGVHLVNLTVQDAMVHPLVLDHPALRYLQQQE